MSGLTSVFGGNDDSDNANQNSSDGNAGGNLVGDATSTLGLDASNHSTENSTDSDGSSDSSTSDQDLSLGTSTDGLLHSVGDIMGSHDAASDSSTN